MKKVTLMIPMSWSDDRVNTVVENYRNMGYEVTIMTIPG